MAGIVRAIWRCPSCKPRYRARLRGWAVRHEVVAFLETIPYDGWKRPPQACPNCGSPLIRAEVEWKPSSL